MKRSKFFNELKEYKSWSVGPSEYIDDNYTVNDNLTVMTPRTRTVGNKVEELNPKELKFKTEEELCAYKTDFGKTLGEYIDELKGFNLIYSPNDEAGGEFRVLNPDGTIHKE